MSGQKPRVLPLNLRAQIRIIVFADALNVAVVLNKCNLQFLEQPLVVLFLVEMMPEP